MAVAVLAWQNGLKDYFADWPTADRWVIPGEHAVHVERPGRYTIYWEHISVLDSIDYSRDDIPKQFEIYVTDSSSGDSIPVATALRGTANYSTKDRAGLSIAAVTLPRPGTYRFETAYVDGSVQPQVVLSIGLDATLFQFIFGLGIIILLTPLLCAIPIIYFAVKKYPPKDGGAPAPPIVQT